MMDDKENVELNSEEMEKVSGGGLPLTAVLKQHVYCAVDPNHRWPIGLDACPVCGSTKFISQIDR